MMGAEYMNTTDCDVFENTTCEWTGTCEYDDGTDGDDEYDFPDYSECDITECMEMYDCQPDFAEFLESCSSMSCHNSCTDAYECFVSFYAYDGTTGMYDCATFEYMADQYMNGEDGDDDDYYDDCDYTCG